MPGSTSKLIQDLNSVPAIVGALGINIAEAQKALNLDYMDNLERLMAMTRSLLAPRDANDQAVELTDDQRNVMVKLVTELAPSRYQFSETTLNVKMDLGQAMDVGGGGSFSGTFGAVAVNASMTVGFGYDYRAAAEVKTVLHAIPASKEVMTELLTRAETLSDKVLTLPEGAAIDQELVNKSHDILGKLVGQEVSKPEEASEQATE